MIAVLIIQNLQHVTRHARTRHARTRLLTLVPYHSNFPITILH